MNLNAAPKQHQIGSLDGPPTIAKLEEKIGIITKAQIKAEDSAIKYAGMTDGLRAKNEKLEHELEVMTAENFQLREQLKQQVTDHEHQVKVLETDRDNLKLQNTELNKTILDLQKSVGKLSARAAYDTSHIDQDELVMDVRALVHENEHLQRTLDESNRVNNNLEALLT